MQSRGVHYHEYRRGKGSFEVFVDNLCGYKNTESIHREGLAMTDDWEAKSMAFP